MRLPARHCDWARADLHQEVDSRPKLNHRSEFRSAAHNDAMRFREAAERRN